MRIYMENNRTEFHPDPISNDGTHVFLKSVAQTRTRTQQEQDA